MPSSAGKKNVGDLVRAGIAKLTEHGEPVSTIQFGSGFTEPAPVVVVAIDQGHRTFFFPAATTATIYTLSLHDALPICEPRPRRDHASRAPLRRERQAARRRARPPPDRKSTRLNSSHSQTSYAVFCWKKKRRRPGARRHRQADRARRAGEHHPVRLGVHRARPGRRRRDRPGPPHVLFSGCHHRHDLHSFPTRRSSDLRASTAARPRFARAASPRAASRAEASSSSTRSEEHTSELQSQSNLVCRLLLEKKTSETWCAPASPS